MMAPSADLPSASLAETRRHVAWASVRLREAKREAEALDLEARFLQAVAAASSLADIEAEAQALLLSDSL